MTTTLELARQLLGFNTINPPGSEADCMRFFAERMKLVVEPTGCLGIAAARAMASELKGKRVGVMISGGNVDLNLFSSLLHS